MAAGSNPSRWPREERSIEVHYEWEGRKKSLPDYLQQVGATSFVVPSDGAIACEWYGNGADAESRLMVWSVAKSFTVTVLAIALREGVIESLDDRVDRYAPQCVRH